MKIKFIRLISTIFILFSALPIISFIASATDNHDAVYQHNLKIYGLQPTDPAVVEFYKLPSRNNEIKSDDERIIGLAKSITENISDDYSKAKAIHDWVADNIYYDLNVLNNKEYEYLSATGALESKRSVCGGYANLTVALLRAVSIPAKYTDGFVNEIEHAWCEAFIGGKWIIIDTTWDSKNKYENGEYKKLPRTDKYFDISLKDISVNHKYNEYSFEFSLFDLSGFTSITIPNGITYIGDYAFQGCINLTSIKIPDSVTIIKESAFQNCTGLTDITIPDSVISIGNSAFANCASLTDIIIPDSITSIGDYAFQNCTGLTDIKISHSITNIGGYGIFQDCASLTNVAIPDGVTNIGNVAFQGCTNLTDIIIPDSVTKIDNMAFQNCVNLANITIPEGVKTIGNDAFEGCLSLTDIIIPYGVTDIGERTFQNCVNLTSITIPKSVINIHPTAFIFNVTKSMQFDDFKAILSDSDYEMFINERSFAVLYDSVTILGLGEVEIAKYNLFINGALDYGVNSKNLTIYGEADSYAEQFAEETGIKFIADSLPETTEANAIITVKEIMETAEIVSREQNNGGRWLLLLILPAAGLIFAGIIIAKKFYLKL